MHKKEALKLLEDFKKRIPEDGEKNYKECKKRIDYAKLTKLHEHVYLLKSVGIIEEKDYLPEGFVFAREDCTIAEQFGLCDNYQQVLDNYNLEGNFVAILKQATPGFRWHKQGKYIGNTVKGYSKSCTKEDLGDNKIYHYYCKEIITKKEDFFRKEKTKEDMFYYIRPENTFRKRL